MNYPVWELHFAGGGFLIALMAVVHVYVAHFAVGGGLFLVLMEMKGYREDSRAILEYTRRHSKFFLLLTMVFGGLTGVGIWFTISLLNPGATSTLIHTFVFGWATEWVCFLGEIVALFIYYYTFGRMRKKDHLLIGWLYFIFAWLSLVLINGIIGFMLTPGDWIETKSFWDGLLNPSFWPSMFFRTALAFVLAGVFGFVTSVFIKDRDFRENMVRYCARWLLFPFFFMLIFAYWYFKVLPPGPQAMILGHSPEIIPFLKAFVWVSTILFLGALVMAIRMPGAVKRPLAFVLLFIGLIYMGSFEWIREAGRRPYIIYGHTYSNSILKGTDQGIADQGILRTAKWVQNKEITEENVLEAGKEIFRLECMCCHSVNGPMNDIVPLTRKFFIFGMDAQLNGLGKINNYMPQFMGTRKERMALARYIVEVIHGKKEEQIRVSRQELPFEIPPFDEEKDEYVLLAWNNIGMRCISDSDSFWTLLPCGNDLYAQLIKRGELPEVVTEEVELIYAVEPGFERPSRHVKFWDYTEHLLGKKIQRDIGLSGNGLKGAMKLEEDLGAFVADFVPVVPYPDDGSYNPYPLFTIEARDRETRKILAQTKVVAPTSTEMGCMNCHGGKWRVAGMAGIADETSMDVLAVHDKNNKTNLLKMARKGQPRLCQGCHPAPVLKAKGNPELLNLSAAMHGWHANYLTERGTEACFKCHPSSQDGATQCLRGQHANNFDCTSCHGTLEDHALGLLKAEHLTGKKGVARLMKHLKPGAVETLEKINPRMPWEHEPDCLNCHVDYERPDPGNATAFNKWTKGPEELYRLRHDDTGALMCEACHNSPHVNYPATNRYGRDRDNIQPLQYQKNRKTIGANNCKLCHTINMDSEAHHINSLN